MTGLRIAVFALAALCAPACATLPVTEGTRVVWCPESLEATVTVEFGDGEGEPPRQWPGGYYFVFSTQGGGTGGGRGSSHPAWQGRAGVPTLWHFSERVTLPAAPTMLSYRVSPLSALGKGADKADASGRYVLTAPEGWGARGASA